MKKLIHFIKKIFNFILFNFTHTIEFTPTKLKMLHNKMYHQTRIKTDYLS